MRWDKPTKKMAYFLSIFTLCTQTLVCTVTYQKLQVEGMSAALKVFDDVRGHLRFVEID